MNELIVIGMSRNQGARFFEQAKKRGYKIILLEEQSFLESNKQLVSNANSTLVIESKKRDKARNIIELLGDNPPQKIFTYDELSVELAAALAESLGATTIGNEVAAIVKDKAKLREIFSATGLPQPVSYICSSEEDVINFIDLSNFDKFIIKPRHGLGSQGVSLITSKTDIYNAISKLNQEDRSDFLIEEFIEGKEFSVEGVIVKGKPIFFGVTEKKIIDNGTFIEVGHTFPAPITTQLEKEIYDSWTKAINALNFNVGLFHAECWETSNGIVLGEIHARPGGDFIHWLQELVTGIETYGAGLDSHFNPDNLSTVTVEKNGVAGIRYFLLPEGEIKYIGNVTEAAAHPSCVRLNMPLKVGNKINEIKHWKDREAVGYMICHAKDRNSLEDAFDQIVKILSIETC
ncbi:MULTISPECIES: ATP-grasp domain-containing protein [unclassified Bartonella]|uniref:ATP-grasp domain-containing protein n=1 Tax=unclassified Bartonella TaxID=2645622 RepID=UPI0035CED7BB